MSILDWFANREKEKNSVAKKNIPGDLWVKCFHCGGIFYLKDLEANNKVCTACNYHFRITPQERIKIMCDQDTFLECDTHIIAKDILNFFDTKSYRERLALANKKTNNKDAIIIGTAKIQGFDINLGIMDFGFMGGSMGSVVGEKITRLVELALKNKNPVIVVTSSGGARMQEGILSLMQMAKTAGSLAKLDQAKIPYITLLCDPTTGGTSASFAFLGDIILAEPGALISFAGPRVIEQTIKQKLPKEFQRSEFLLKHGMIDKVVDRKNLKTTLGLILSMFSQKIKKKNVNKK